MKKESSRAMRFRNRGKPQSESGFFELNGKTLTKTGTLEREHTDDNPLKLFFWASQFEQLMKSLIHSVIIAWHRMYHSHFTPTAQNFLESLCGLPNLRSSAFDKMAFTQEKAHGKRD
jgi:hypothetical protein